MKVVIRNVLAKNKLEMIELIKTAVYLTWSIINYGFYISYKTGYFLVNVICFLQKVIARLGYLLYEVFGVIFESLSIFYQDIGLNFHNVLRTLSSVDIIMYLSDVRNIIQTLTFIIVKLSDFVLKTFSSVVTIIETILLTPKYLVVYLFKSASSATLNFKEAISELISFLFGSIHFWFTKTRDYAITGILFWINLPQALYELVIDVPIESMLSITLSCCLIYLFVRFYVIVLSFLYRQFERMFTRVRRLYFQYRRRFTRSTPPNRMVYRRQIVPTRRPHIRPEKSRINLSQHEENDRFCVICQERIKCILLLPCRHLCMCNDCINTLQLYHNTCPICRSEIETTMQIFV